MLLIALLTIYLFLRGIRVGNEWIPVMEVLAEQSRELVQTMKPGHIIFGSPWTIFLLILAHVPLGMLPHIGNKLWALKSAQDRRRFLLLAFIFAMILPCMALGGLMARALLGDQLLLPGSSANEAVPALFIEIMPAWLAALLCIAILSAVMSTADGLVVSASQVFANDLYRRSIAPRWHADLTATQLEDRVLTISRYATVLILLGSAALAWALIDINVALIVWIGIGGMTSALAGPLLLGSLWQGVNKAGAIAGMLVGALGFIVLHTGLVTSLLGLPDDAWLSVQSSNSFTCSGLGILASMLATTLVTWTTGARVGPPDQAQP
jgi:Na+/proline symporter